jgi:hypothetical protein
MSSDDGDMGDGAADDGVVNATFLDALRLMWFPSSLPRIAMTLRTRAALLAGAICWFGFGGAVMAGVGRFAGWPADPLLAFFNQFVMGGMIAVFAVIPIASFASLDADLTTEHRRARVRLFLLLPGPLVLPGVLWAGVAALNVPIAGSMWWLAAFGVALLLLLQRGWDKMLSRSTSDRCIGCGYLLIGLPQRRCPECGRAFYPGQTVK